tara:strand:- start:451 stop:603 length:153 start_codon:yes stop_codon:yes gene_type:complete
MSGQAIEEYGRSELPFYQGKNEQCMVHSAKANPKEYATLAHNYIREITGL